MVTWMDNCATVAQSPSKARRFVDTPDALLSPSPDPTSDWPGFMTRLRLSPTWAPASDNHHGSPGPERRSAPARSRMNALTTGRIVESSGPILIRESLGGLLEFYFRQVA